MNDITALRSRLFETLDALKDKENPMEIDRAKAVVDVAQVIINSAKVEVDYARTTGAQVTNFLGSAPGPKGTGKSIAQTPTGHVIREGNVTVHKLK